MATSANAGDFTCAELVTILAKSDMIWADNQQKRDYQSYVGALEAVRNEQTARLSKLEDPSKDNTVKLYWAADCSTSLADCSDDCTVGGPELEAACKEYTLDLCKTAGFSVKEKAFRSSELNREEVVAKGLLKRMKELDEYLAQMVVTKLNTFAGTNQFAGIGTVDGGTTYIAASFWTADIIGYFQQVAVMNKFSSAYLLHGTNLWQTKWQAGFNNLNQNEKDELAKLNNITQYWDPFNVDTVNATTKASYLISKGAIAFVSKAYYPTTPTNYIGVGQTRYSIESKNLPGVFYDVVYTNSCTSNEITHSWSLYVKAGIFQNPLGCDETVTGVVKFVCGAAPVSS